MNSTNGSNLSQHELIKISNSLTELRARIELSITLYDDLASIVLKLEQDLFQSGFIKKKFSDDGALYDIYKDS